LNDPSCPLPNGLGFAQDYPYKLNHKRERGVTMGEHYSIYPTIKVLTLVYSLKKIFWLAAKAKKKVRYKLKQLGSQSDQRNQKGSWRE
jgi:hypothetical protein